MKGIFGALVSGIGGIFTGAYKAVGWLIGWRRPSARFMSWWDRFWKQNARNKGFLVDGRAARITETATYQSMLIQGGMGTGKSSAFVMPNLLKPSPFGLSFVISDMSGEIYQRTSGYLARRDYQIRVLNLMDVTRSERYGPLELAKAPNEIADLVKTLVTSANGRRNPGVQDPFWEQAAEKLIRTFIQCLQNQPDPRFRNLANLRHLITSFDAHTAPKGQLGKIDQFVLGATQNDPQTYQSYQAFTKGNLKAIQSVLMSADVALDGVATPETQALTASNSFAFDELRQTRTALYITVNQTQMQLYAFLLNLFCADLFRSLLKNSKGPGRPVWLFLDEFGHLTIPGFEVFATTARKYKVAFALLLQSMNRLDSREADAKRDVQRYYELTGPEFDRGWLDGWHGKPSRPGEHPDAYARGYDLGQREREKERSDELRRQSSRDQENEKEQGDDGRERG